MILPPQPILAALNVISEGLEIDHAEMPSEARYPLATHKIARFPVTRYTGLRSDHIL
jgi:hypothetical protein